MGFFDGGWNPVPAITNGVSGAVQAAGNAVSSVSGAFGTAAQQAVNAGEDLKNGIGGSTALAVVNPYNALLTQKGREENYKVYKPIVQPVAQTFFPSLIPQVEDLLNQFGLGGIVNNLFGANTTTNNEGGNAYSQGEGGTYYSSTSAKSYAGIIAAVAVVGVGIYFLTRK